MRSIEEDIKVLSRTVLSEVRSDVDQNLEEARNKAEAIKKQAQEEAATKRADILANASAEAERLRGQAIASTQLKARTMQLEQREKLLKEVFDTAKQKLSLIQQSNDYEKNAQKLLREALISLGASAAKVRTDASTQKLFTASVLEKMSKELNIQIRLGEPLERGIGVIVETEDGHRQYDNTLETRLKRLQDTLRAPVYHILMGEPL
jgi:V/A-type H+/Na+-transporting ATPase subunit E